MPIVYQIWYHQWEVFPDGRKVRHHTKVATVEFYGPAMDKKRKLAKQTWFNYHMGDRLSLRRVL